MSLSDQVDNYHQRLQALMAWVVPAAHLMVAARLTSGTDHMFLVSNLKNPAIKQRLRDADGQSTMIKPPGKVT